MMCAFEDELAAGFEKHCEVHSIKSLNVVLVSDTVANSWPEQTSIRIRYNMQLEKLHFK